MRSLRRVFRIVENKVFRKVLEKDTYYPVSKYENVYSTYIEIPQKVHVDYVEPFKELQIRVEEINAFPNVCVVHKTEKGNRIVCINTTRDERDRLILGSVYEELVPVISKIASKRKDLIDFLVNNNISIIVQEMPPVGGSVTLGRARCDTEYGGYIMINKSLFANKERLLEVLLHEMAHCKEQIVRKERNLPKMFAKWERKESKLIPIGGEKRAESFVERMKKVLI